MNEISISQHRQTGRVLVYVIGAALGLTLFGLIWLLGGLVISNSSFQLLVAAVTSIIVLAFLAPNLPGITGRLLDWQVNLSEGSNTRKDSFALDTTLVKLGQVETLEELAGELTELLQKDLQITFAAFGLYSVVHNMTRWDYSKFQGDSNFEPLFRKLTKNNLPEQFGKPRLVATETATQQYAVMMKLEAGRRQSVLLCLGPKVDDASFELGELEKLEKLATPLAVRINNIFQMRELENKLKLAEESCNQLRRNRDELQLINQHTVQTAEEERNGLVQELQDGTLQKLNQLDDYYKIRLPNISEAEELAWHLALDAQRALQNTITRLRPASLDQLGLAAALEGMKQDIQRRVRLAIKLKVAPELEVTRLPHDIELAMYRFAEEALENVVKHAKAQHVTINLTKINGAVRLVVLDDGIGFDPPTHFTSNGRQDHLGLAGIEERLTNLGGTLRIRSSVGAGAVVEAEVPVVNLVKAAG